MWLIYTVPGLALSGIKREQKTHPFSVFARAIACILAAGGRELVSCPRPLRAAWRLACASHTWRETGEVKEGRGRGGMEWPTAEHKGVPAAFGVFRNYVLLWVLLVALEERVSWRRGSGPPRQTQC